MTACTFLSSKWPALASSGLVLLRASAGRIGDDAGAGARRPRAGRPPAPGGDGGARHDQGARDDARRPVAARLPAVRARPPARVERIEAALATLPGLTVAGAAYRGLGLAACVRQAGEAADRIAADIARRLREDGPHG